MSRGIRRTITVVMVLITVFIIFSSGAFSKPLVKIDTEGLKGVHIRANIIKGLDPSGHGHIHGRVQVIITEDYSRHYMYKFLIELKRASGPYTIQLWANMPNIDIIIHGDGSLNWIILEGFAVQMGIDKYGLDGKIDTSLERLGLMGYWDVDTGIVITTDERGYYKNIITGEIDEMEAIEQLIDFGTPLLKEQLILRYPGHQSLINWFFSIDRDFAEFGIKGVTIPGGIYTISMGARFIGPAGPGGDDNFCTEDITFTHVMGKFEWWAPVSP